MKRWLALMSFLMAALFAQPACATAQFPEALLLDGEKVALFTNPLDSWLRVPDHAARLKPYQHAKRCSASWRGYRGTWEIRHGRLYLVSLVANPCSGTVSVPLSALFPGKDAPVFASWFSGRLTVPQGKRTQYVHMGYRSQYERYILIDIEQGRVTHRKTENSLSSHPEPSSSRQPVPFVGE